MLLSSLIGNDEIDVCCLAAVLNNDKTKIHVVLVLLIAQCNSPDVAAGTAATSKRRGLGTLERSEDEEDFESALIGNPGDDKNSPRERQCLLAEVSLSGPLSDGIAGSRDQTLVEEGNGVVDKSTGTSFPGTILDCSRNCFPARSAREGGEGVPSFWSSPEGARHIAVTAAILWLSYAIAMTVADLGLVLEVRGRHKKGAVVVVCVRHRYLVVHMFGYVFVFVFYVCRCLGLFLLYVCGPARACTTLMIVVSPAFKHVAQNVHSWSFVFINSGDPKIP